MKNFEILLGAALAAIPNVSAHYFFPHFIADGNFTEYYEYVREDTQGYMPFRGGYSSDDFRCNTGSQQYASKTGVYKVKAGDTIGFGTDFNALIQHPGPLQVYMSKAPGDVREYDGSGGWFKIYELGPESFSSDGITWGATDIGNFTFELPKEVPSGQYLVRIEHIALHGAGEWGGAEFYFNCAQIEVESDSSATPYPLVQIPGVYDGYEPGILFYMYRPYIVNYTMPGPRAFPDATIANITASGLSVAPTYTPWTAEAVTRTPLSVSALPSGAVSSKSGAISSKSTFVSTPLVRETNVASSLPLQMTETPDFISATTPTSNVKTEAISTGSVAIPTATVSDLANKACGPTETVTVHKTITVSSDLNKPSCIAGTLTTTTTTTVTVSGKST